MIISLSVFLILLMFISCVEDFQLHITSNFDNMFLFCHIINENIDWVLMQGQPLY